MDLPFSRHPFLSTLATLAALSPMIACGGEVAGSSGGAEAIVSAPKPGACAAGAIAQIEDGYMVDVYDKHPITVDSSGVLLSLLTPDNNSALVSGSLSGGFSPLFVFDQGTMLLQARATADTVFLSLNAAQGDLEIDSLPRGGGSPVLLGTLQAAPIDITVGSSALYLGTDSELGALPANGGPLTSLDGSAAEALAIDGSTLYWAQNQGSFAADSGVPASVVLYSASLEGAFSPQVVTTIYDSFVSNLAVSAGQVVMIVWSADGSTFDQNVYVGAAASGTLVPIASFGPPTPVAGAAPLAIANGAAYYALADGILWRMDLASQQITQIHSAAWPVAAVGASAAGDVVYASLHCVYALAQ